MSVSPALKAVGGLPGFPLLGRTAIFSIAVQLLFWLLKAHKDSFFQELPSAGCNLPHQGFYMSPAGEG